MLPGMRSGGCGARPGKRRQQQSQVNPLHGSRLPRLQVEALSPPGIARRQRVREAGWRRREGTGAEPACLLVRQGRQPDPARCSVTTRKLPNLKKPLPREPVRGHRLLDRPTAPQSDVYQVPPGA